MSKPYGLLIPNKGAKITPAANFSRPSVFNNSDDSDDDDCPSKTSINGPGANQKRQARLIQAKALEEDPTIFQYDELYDEMDNKRQEVKKAKTEEIKQPKYIKRLLETADKRKKEQERRIERQVQKEREAEGEMFKDKESFVTSAYRKKLEEMKEAEAEEKREAYLESIGDVTKQRDLGGFYRHLYEQKLGTEEKLSDKEDDPKIDNNVPTKFIEKSKKERIYRKRKSSVDEHEEDEVRANEAKKAHLQSNLDADSDFSIDSSESEAEEEEQAEKDILVITPTVIVIPTIKTEPAPEAQLIESPKIKEPEPIKTEVKEEAKDEPKTPPIPEEPPKPRIDIWKKRTIGDVLDGALERYYQRKAARESG